MEEDLSPLPLPPLAMRGVDAQAIARLPWQARWRQRLWQYLPVAVMAVIAVVTGWLVRQAPVHQETGLADRRSGEPDYEMRGFSVQHYTEGGPAQGVIEGDVVRHYPLNDQLLIDGVRVRWTDRAGRTLHASARRAIAAGDGSMVRLEGGARVVRDPAPGDSEAFEFGSEVLVFDVRAGSVRSERPVQLRQGMQTIDAAALVYDHPQRLVELSGAVQGRILPPTAP